MTASTAGRPNLLFIMSDDHAAHAISAYSEASGRPVLSRTPHLDRLAREGMRFDSCFCTNSICTPSRATILTGTYNHVNAVTTLEGIDHPARRNPVELRRIKVSGKDSLFAFRLRMRGGRRGW